MTFASYLIRVLLAMVLLPALSCHKGKSDVVDVRITHPGNDVLAALVEVETAGPLDAFVTYWKSRQEDQPKVSEVSKAKQHHKFLLADLEPGQSYVLQVSTVAEGNAKAGEAHRFKTLDYRPGQKDTFEVVCADPALVPPVFKEGFVLVHRREEPGLIALLNAEGNVVWHYQAKAGFKVVHFTEQKTFLCLLGTKDYQTSYGNAILEVSLAGDTLLYLKKGQNDFQQTIHHEILRNTQNELVTLCVEERVLDLRSKGGGARDTVRGDGILVLDREGRKVWKWTVFDALDPLQDEAIVQSRQDWMHANSLSFDRDGHYLISFYNNGQIWKVNAVTGKVMWRLGRGGDFSLPPMGVFDQAHAVHKDDRGWLLLFDNGVENKVSRSIAYRLDENARKAWLLINTMLPPSLYSDRMGSSYLIGDTALLQCSSKQKTVALTNFRGSVLWQLKSSVMSYRAQFIPKAMISTYSVH